MVAKLATALSLAALVCLTLAPGAGAVGVGKQRAVTAPRHEAAPRATTSSSLIAPDATCPGQDSLSAAAAAQVEAMRCMTDFARVSAGLGPLADAEQLDQSAADKAADVLRCDSFSHFACGREFTYWIRATGYIGEACWHAGENLAWGTDEYGSVRSIFRAWMNSPSHRENILGEYAQVGISLATGDLEGKAGAHVWAAHFGSRCEG
jgi:uncharacterized protein YkwD